MCWRVILLLLLTCVIRVHNVYMDICMHVCMYVCMEAFWFMRGLCTCVRLCAGENFAAAAVVVYVTCA